MHQLEPNVSVLAPPPPRTAKLPSDPVAAGTGLVRRLVGLFGRLVPTVLALGCVAGLVAVGQATGWSLPKFSALRGDTGPAKDDWCAEHGVPESICVECQKAGRAPVKELGWCRQHGVPECPLEHPEVAQLPSTPLVTPEDCARADRALAFAPRVENNSKCRLHHRDIQFASADVLARLGVGIVQVAQAPVTETVTAPGEITYNPTRVARLSARVPGTVWRVEKQVGDKVRRGDVLALVDAVEVGKVKAEFQQALVNLDLRNQSLATLRASTGTVAGRAVQEAEAELEQARVRLLTSEQALANLGLPLTADAVRGLSPADLAGRAQFLGLPEPLARQLAGQTGSSNLLAVTAPLDGEVVARTAVAGEAADPAKPLFVVADTGRLWLTLRVRLEDANRLRPGQPVQFSHEGHTGGDAGIVAWVSPTADEKSRAVAVRVELPNPSGRHHANTFGTARVVLREEPMAVVVPSEAVHWEGDCHIVFVRDKDFDTPGAPKVFHVRKVRPGGQDVAATGPVTEIAAGLLPGEYVAAANSGILRTELLKNNLGAG